ncbi:MAG: patatin-like phospholipase family protein [Actinomycetota bacterium]|nr:patatin-like phospholipase family protein [Actinomycetota bacterium]
MAWELGVLQGLQEVNADLLAKVIGADVVVGTSAGSTVAAQITSGTALDTLYAAQLSEESAEIEVDVDLRELTARFAKIAETGASATDIRRRIGALALATQTTVDEPTYRASRAARLTVQTWPARDVRLVSVDVESGEPTVFTRDSGVALVDAVAASSAFPGIWPPVTIGEHRYMDGAVRSPTNADLAAGCDRVLVLTPSSADPRGLFGSLEDEIKLLEPADVRVIYADAASLAAFGTNPLSPSARTPAAQAGRNLGRTRAADLEWFAR